MVVTFETGYIFYMITHTKLLDTTCKIIIRKQKALKKYGMDSIEAIANIVTNGQGNMSAYKDRLTAEEIQAVSAYVLQQAEAGWRKQ